MKTIKNFITYLFFLFLTGLNLHIFANTPLNDDGWHFSVAPYFWMSSMDADITIQNITNHIYLPFSKAIKHFDGGAEAHIEAGYGPLTFMIDPTYVKLSGDFSNDLANGDITSKTTLIDGGIFYRVYATPLSATSSLSLEVLGGARYLKLSNDLNFNFINTPGPGLSLSSSMSVAAPIIGARLGVMANPKVNIWLRADVGGFGVDDVTNTWSWTTGFTYNVCKHTDLGLAFRVLNIDVTKNNASTKTLMYGPILGINFHFS